MQNIVLKIIWMLNVDIYQNLSLKRMTILSSPVYGSIKRAQLKFISQLFIWNGKYIFGVLGNNICVVCSSSRSSTCIPVCIQCICETEEEGKKKKISHWRYSLCVLLYLYNIHLILPKTKEKAFAFLYFKSLCWACCGFNCSENFFSPFVVSDWFEYKSNFAITWEWSWWNSIACKGQRNPGIDWFMNIWANAIFESDIFSRKKANRKRLFSSGKFHCCHRFVWWHHGIKYTKELLYV